MSSTIPPLRPLPRHAQVTGWTKTDLKRTKLICAGCTERIVGPVIGRYVRVVFIDGGKAANPQGPFHERCADEKFSGLPCFGGGKLGAA